MAKKDENTWLYWLLSILLSAAALYTGVTAVSMHWGAGVLFPVDWTAFVYYAVAFALLCFGCRFKDKCK